MSQMELSSIDSAVSNQNKISFKHEIKHYENFFINPYGKHYALCCSSGTDLQCDLPSRYEYSDVGAGYHFCGRYLPRVYFGGGCVASRCNAND